MVSFISRPNQGEHGGVGSAASAPRLTQAGRVASTKFVASRISRAPSGQPIGAMRVDHLMLDGSSRTTIIGSIQAGIASVPAPKQRPMPPQNVRGGGGALGRNLSKNDVFRETVTVSFFFS